MSSGGVLGKEVLSKVLEYLGTRGYVTVDELERALGLGRGDAELVLGLLLSEGVVGEVRECSLYCRCSLAGGCILKYGYNVRVYRKS